MCNRVCICVVRRSISGLVNAMIHATNAGVLFGIPRNVAGGYSRPDMHGVFSTSLFEMFRNLLKRFKSCPTFRPPAPSFLVSTYPCSRERTTLSPIPLSLPCLDREYVCAHTSYAFTPSSNQFPLFTLANLMSPWTPNMCTNPPAPVLLSPHPLPHTHTCSRSISL